MHTSPNRGILLSGEFERLWSTTKCCNLYEKGVTSQHDYESVGDKCMYYSIANLIVGQK